MQKISIFTGLLAILCLSKAPEAHSQFNHGFYGLNQVNMDAGKLLTINPNNQAIAILESNPFTGTTASFNITRTNGMGGNFARTFFYDVNFQGNTYQFRPNTFLHMPMNNTYMITGNVIITMINGQTYESVFSLLLNSNLVPINYHIYTGDPVNMSPLQHRVHSTSAVAYQNPGNGSEEVLVYAQMTNFFNPADADILLITLDNMGMPISSHQVLVATSYADNGYIMNELQISSIDVRGSTGRFLATGSVNVSGIWGPDLSPFILDIELDQGSIPALARINQYEEENLNEVGNATYHVDANGDEYIYFTFSGVRPYTASGCITPNDPILNVLSLDLNALSPINQREIFVECAANNLDRPYLFPPISPGQLVNVGFTQDMMNNLTTGGMQVGAMVAELDMDPGGFTTIYRYNFLENTSFSFRSADYLPPVVVGAQPSYILNTTYHGADYRSNIINTYPNTPHAPCTELPNAYTQDLSYPHFELEMQIQQIAENHEVIPVNWSTVFLTNTICNFYRPAASNSLTEMTEAVPFNVFPNPVHNDQITIQGSFEQGDQLYLLNAAGQIVYKQPLQEGSQHQIHLPGSLATGIYMLQITNNKTIKHQDKLYRMQ